MLTVGVTLRSIVIGLILIPVNCFWVVIAEIMWYSGEPTTISLFYNVIFILTLLILGNLAVRRFKPAWALTPPEILVVYTMLAIASALCGHDMLEILVPILSHLYRYAPIEGRFREILPYIPDWLVVKDPAALQSAYIGQESMYRAENLVPWLGPLAWWSRRSRNSRWSCRCRRGPRFVRRKARFRCIRSTRTGSVLPPYRRTG